MRNNLHKLFKFFTVSMLFVLPFCAFSASTPMSQEYYPTTITVSFVNDISPPGPYRVMSASNLPNATIKCNGSSFCPMVLQPGQRLNLEISAKKVLFGMLAGGVYFYSPPIKKKNGMCAGKYFATEESFLFRTGNFAGTTMMGTESLQNPTQVVKNNVVMTVHYNSFCCTDPNKCFGPF